MTIRQDNSHWRSRDLDVVWHPCTQMQDHETLPMIPIERGRGVWLHDFDGNKYIDAVSSWWVNLFGHANPSINAAISKQMDTLEHVMLAGFSHQAVIELSERLVDITPPELDRVFYGDNGSSAIEIALKMSFHYHANCGHPERTRFINLSNSYHGETLGALAVGDVALYKETYGPLMMEPITVDAPDAYGLPREQWAEAAQNGLAKMRKALEAHAQHTCAVIIEPLVQCAGSMRMYDPSYLTGLRQLCDEFGVHLIADEIAVGFGRTGTLFACEQGNITPDFMCLSKGLTGGYLPLSAVLTSNTVYQAFYDRYETLKGFLHSHSYTGNALACRAALATLDLFEQSDVLGNNQSLAETLGQAIAPLADHPQVGDVRQTGMIAAVEMVQDKRTHTPYPWQQRRGMTVFQHALTRGVLLRPLGNVIYFMPPYVITEQQIQHVAKVAAEGIELATRD